MRSYRVWNIIETQDLISSLIKLDNDLFSGYKVSEVHMKSHCVGYFKRMLKFNAFKGHEGIGKAFIRKDLWDAFMADRGGTAPVKESP